MIRVIFNYTGSSGEKIPQKVLESYFLTHTVVYMCTNALFVSKSVQTCLILFLSALTDEQFLCELTQMNFNSIAEIQGGYMHNRKVRKKFPTKIPGLFYMYPRLQW